MIAAAQKVEHYEIATYGTIRVWANLLNRTDVGAIFEDTLEDEKTADLKLTNIAESFINQEAAAEGRGRETKRVSARPRRQAAADKKR